MTTVSARAPGKINPVLRVGPRNETGYHELFTVFQALELWETVTVENAETYRVTLEGDLPLDQVPLDESNIVVQAAVALAEAIGHDGAAAFHIHKNIPVGGGMGGGSADAAAALVALNELWGNQADTHTLHTIAAGVGADVPFALHGGSALGRGNGSSLEALNSSEFFWVLLPIDHHLSTPEVYARFDALTGGNVEELPNELPPQLVEALATGDAETLAVFLENDLGPMAADLYPPLISGLMDSEMGGALRTMVSGSGPTLVALTRDASHQADLVQTLNDKGHRPIPTVSTPRGAHLV